MKRRQALSMATGFGVAALAGCLDRGGSGGDDPADDEPTEDGTPTPTPTPEPVLASKSFSVTGTGSGESSQRATVTFDDEVRLTGTITGNNGCYTAKLAEANVRDRTFSVTVEAVEDRDDDEVCTQALLEIDYEATFQFEGTLPETVVVRHDSMGEVQTVAETER